MQLSPLSRQLGMPPGQTLAGLTTILSSWPAARKENCKTKGGKCCACITIFILFPPFRQKCLIFKEKAVRGSTLSAYNRSALAEIFLKAVRLEKVLCACSALRSFLLRAEALCTCSKGHIALRH